VPYKELAGRYRTLIMELIPSPCSQRRKVQRCLIRKPRQAPFSTRIQTVSVHKKVTTQKRKQTGFLGFLIISSLAPYYSHTTSLFLYWLRQNLDLFITLGLKCHNPYLLVCFIATGFKPLRFFLKEISQWLIRNLIYCLWHGTWYFYSIQCSVS